MKTKDEVFTHLFENGYSEQAIDKILGFMIGKDLKGVDEMVKYKKGTLSFDDFWNWFHDIKKDEELKGEEEFKTLELDYCPMCVVESLIEDVTRNIFSCAKYGYNPTLISRYERQLEFLKDIREVFDVEDED